MRKYTTAQRLHQIMQEQNLKQVDILSKAKPFCEQYNVKLGRNDLSQYCSGKVEPKQDKLVVLSNALNVTETWLMGFDVPMKDNNDYEDTGSMFADIAMNPELLEVVSKLTKLKDSDRDIVVNLINSLYEKEN